MARYPEPQEPVLALYDCRSKQEYIYRTDRMQEITGASALLAGLFSGFFSPKNTAFRFKTDWRTAAIPSDFLKAFQEGDYDAEIVYEGGGNLCVIFRNHETYVAVNRALSRKVLDDTFSVGVISAYTRVTGDFYGDRERLYKENARRKNLGANAVACNALPFTLVDRTTFQPVVKKKDDRFYTSESWKKQEAFDRLNGTDHGEQNLDGMTHKGEKSILAVIYIDGNNMGQKIKNITERKKDDPIRDYTEGVAALRAFSKQTDNDFVVKPLKAIKNVMNALEERAEQKNKYLYKYRKVIGGGDEITLVCNARAVPVILGTYFKTLTASGKNSACAGIVLFHSHMPFADVYDIAEQCCESAKKESHKEGNGDKNYIDFHFCHAGITNDLEKIRETQEGGKRFSAKPYEFSTTWQSFRALGKALLDANRSDVKALYEGMVAGESYYSEVLRQIHSRKKLADISDTDEEKKRMVFDIASIFDLWKNWFREEGI